MKPPSLQTRIEEGTDRFFSGALKWGFLAALLICIGPPGWLVLLVLWIVDGPHARRRRGDAQ